MLMRVCAHLCEGQRTIWNVTIHLFLKLILFIYFLAIACLPGAPNPHFPSHFPPFPPISPPLASERVFSFSPYSPTPSLTSLSPSLKEREGRGNGERAGAGKQEQEREEGTSGLFYIQ